MSTASHRMYLLFLRVVHLRGEGTRLRREVKKRSVTSHQELENLAQKRQEIRTILTEIHPNSTLT
jgi:hypothetical protein